MKKLIICIYFVLIAISLQAQSPGNALNFDGTNDMVVCSTVPALFSNLTNNDFTFEAWVYPSGAVFSRIIFAQSSTTNFATLSTSTSNQIYFYVIANGTTYSVVTNNTLPLNQWTHVAARWNSATLTPEVFFNGIIQTTAGGGGSSNGTSGLLTIGTRPGGAQYFNGSLDEIRIWNEARSDCEILGSMNSDFTVTQPNLVAYYNFNQGVPGGNNVGITTLPDLTTGFNGTLTNFTLSGATSNWITSGAIINQSNQNSSDYNIFLSNTLCAGDSIFFNNQFLLNSGVYYDSLTTINGCDSIVTLTLNVNTVSGSSSNVSACDQYIFNSQVLTNTGIYYDTLSNVNGCDSIITLNLIINNTTGSIVNETACNEFLFNSTMLTSSGTYYDTLNSISGCDSIITLNLTINSADTGVTQSGTTLTANAVGSSYQWLDCNNNYAVLTGEIGSSFIANQNGSYALMITENGCTDTSLCFTINSVGVLNQGVNNDKLYPNPTNSIIYFSTEEYKNITELRILSIDGRLIYKINTITNNGLIFDLSNYKNGIYVIEIYREGTKNVYPIVKQ